MALWKETAQSEQVKKPEPEAATARVSPIHERRDTAVRNRQESIVGTGVLIEGKINGEGDVRIAGQFKGDIQIKGDLNIEKGAHLAAMINANAVTIEGTIEGNVVANAQVKLMESGELIGDLKASILTVAAGSKMRGNIDVSGVESEVEAVKVANIRAHEKAKNTAASTPAPAAALSPAPTPAQT